MSTSTSQTQDADGLPVFAYDMDYPPLNVRHAGAQPLTDEEWKRIHADFFARIQRCTNAVSTKALLACGMEFREFAFRHLRQSHNQRRCRNDDYDDGDENDVGEQ